MNETIVVEDGQAAVATTAVSGTLSSKSSATDTIAIVDTPSGKQAAVVTTSVSGTLSPASSATDTIAVVDTPSGKQAALKVYNLNGGGGGGGGGGASSAADVSFNPSGLNVITETNVQGALAQVDSSVKGLQDSVSVLTTSDNLLNEIGGKTTVALADLTAMAIVGRPSYKQAGATVYDGNGVVGIIDSVDSTNAVITTVQYGVGDIAAALNAINGENI